MIEVVHVNHVKALSDTTLSLIFSDGSTGVWDAQSLLDEGGSMVEPLRNPANFRRAFVHCGVVTWPNGFDLDSIRLYKELKAAGLLGSASRTAAE
jgi:hypothetical protein